MGIPVLLHCHSWEKCKVELALSWQIKEPFLMGTQTKVTASSWMVTLSQCGKEIALLWNKNQNRRAQIYISLFHHGSKLPASWSWSVCLLVNSGISASHFMKGDGAEERGETTLDIWIPLNRTASYFTNLKINLFLFSTSNCFPPKESPGEISFL